MPIKNAQNYLHNLMSLGFFFNVASAKILQRSRYVNCKWHTLLNKVGKVVGQNGIEAIFLLFQNVFNLQCRFFLPNDFLLA